jgi:hypothetical protein
MRAPLAFVAAAALLLSAAAPLPAEAGCKRMAFLVNDYGKDGPTKDAKSLLDKHITEWAAQQGIKDYSVGTKSVSCYQFLNFIVFDEHTCTASANVCWGPDKKAVDATAAAATGTPPTPVRKTAAAADATTHKTHKHKGTEPAAHADAATLAPAQDAAPAEADTAAAAPAAEVAPAAVESAPVAEPAAPAAAVETGATAPSVETGALGPAGPDAAAPAASSEVSGKIQASEAASAAAAAAERAAAAAETAANAAKEAAAAAVAASAAGRGSFVPPLGEAKAHALGDAR